VAAPFALVNIVGRPLGNQLRVLRRLRRNRGLAYVADFLFARAWDGIAMWMRRNELRHAVRAFPEIDARRVREIRARHPHLDCHDPHAPHVLEFVRGHAPDYILLAGAPFLRPSFYGLARQAALNRHLGLLPDFRGSDCAIWALALNRPDQVGYSIHVVNERVDGGDVVLRRPLPVNGDATLDDYLRRLRREASEAYVGVVSGLLRGATLRALPQARRGPYFPPAGWTTQRRAVRNYARAAGGASA
jgi:folate-dependent phosphoribosylglycinamide formyltransferase PurN